MNSWSMASPPPYYRWGGRPFEVLAIVGLSAGINILSGLASGSQQRLITLAGALLLVSGMSFFYICARVTNYHSDAHERRLLPPPHREDRRKSLQNHLEERVLAEQSAATVWTEFLMAVSSVVVMLTALAMIACSIRAVERTPDRLVAKPVAVCSGRAPARADAIGRRATADREAPVSEPAVRTPGTGGPVPPARPPGAKP